MYLQAVQEAGDFVISWTGGHHQGFNIGLNMAEAVNFADKRWLALNIHDTYKVCNCL